MNSVVGIEAAGTNVLILLVVLIILGIMVDIDVIDSGCSDIVDGFDRVGTAGNSVSADVDSTGIVNSAGGVDSVGGICSVGGVNSDGDCDNADGAVNSVNSVDIAGVVDSGDDSAGGVVVEY